MRELQCGKYAACAAFSSPLRDKSLRNEVIMRNSMMSESEMAFARIIWENEPVRSGELVQLCNEAFGWKKSTTYTVLKNLCNEGIFKNENAVVTSLVNEDAYLERESTQIVNERFDGSISKFVTAFANKKRLSKKQILELKKIIEESEP